MFSYLRCRASIILKIIEYSLLLYAAIKNIKIRKFRAIYLPLNIDLLFLSAKVSDLRLIILLVYR